MARIDTIKREELAINLFRFFEENNILYTVVGDTRKIEAQIDSDIDIVVCDKKISKVILLLFQYCELSGTRVVQIVQYEPKGWSFFLKNRDIKGRLVFIQPDICTDYYHHGRMLLSAQELIHNTSRGQHGFFLLNPPKSFIYYLLKKINKQSLNQKQFEYLCLEWGKDIKGAKQEIGRFWLEKDVACITESFRNNDLELLQNSLKQLQQSIVRITRNPWPDGSKEIVRKIIRTLQPTGLFVVFLGADGSGKSSVIDQVEKTFSQVFRSTKRYHFRPHFGRNYNGLPVSEPHALPPRNTLFSISKLLFWLIDYFWGYSSDIFLRLVRSNIVIFDRYYYDLLVDPKRYRYGSFILLVRIISLFVPRPDLVILLDAPPEVLNRRKQEVEMAETIRQRSSYLALVNTMPYGHVVDSSKPIDEVVMSVEEIIFDYLAHRTAARWIGEKFD